MLLLEQHSRRVGRRGAAARRWRRRDDGAPPPRPFSHHSSRARTRCDQHRQYATEHSCGEGPMDALQSPLLEPPVRESSAARYPRVASSCASVVASAAVLLGLVLFHWAQQPSDRLVLATNLVFLGAGILWAVRFALLLPWACARDNSPAVSSSVHGPQPPPPRGCIAVGTVVLWLVAAALLILASAAALLHGSGTAQQGDGEAAPSARRAGRTNRSFLLAGFCVFHVGNILRTIQRSTDYVSCCSSACTCSRTGSSGVRRCLRSENLPLHASWLSLVGTALLVVGAGLTQFELDVVGDPDALNEPVRSKDRHLVALIPLWTASLGASLLLLSSLCELFWATGSVTGR